MKLTLSSTEWKLVQASLHVMTIQGKDSIQVADLLDKVEANFIKSVEKES